MKKIVILFLTLFLISCVQIAQNNSPGTSSEGKVMINIVSPQESCNDIQNSGQRDLCYLDALKNEKEPSLCKKFTDYDLTVKCYIDIANSTKNPNVCIILTTDVLRDSCYLAAAIAKNDPVVCGGIIFQETRAKCFDKMNLKNLDEFEVCTQIQTKEAKSECFDEFKART